jgi:hypothetical protein
MESSLKRPCHGIFRALSSNFSPSEWFKFRAAASNVLLLMGVESL